MSRPTFRPRVEGLEDRLAPAVFYVFNSNNAGAGSLRAAITGANTAAGPDSISFNIPGNGTHTINLTSALPTISETVAIDGTTQPGFVSTPVIALNGAAAGAGVNGLVVAGAAANGCTIKGLVVQRFGGNGIVLYSDTNSVKGCFIGTSAAGTAIATNRGSGIAIFGASSGNTIGGTLTDRNLISGNGIHGVAMRGSGVTGNTVRGNFIGTNITGTLAFPNRYEGVAISQGASANTIGDTTAGNFIAGNNRHGIYLGGIGTTSNTISNNIIGSSLSCGVYIAAGAASNTVGGVTAGLGNVISSNGTHGIVITGAGTRENAVQGNFIGTAANGAQALANRHDGVQISNGAFNNTIGGSVAGASNLISANGRFGVNITGAGTSENTVSGNIIGLDYSATVPLSNGSSGVQIAGGAFANLIGGDTTAERNLISGNKRHGIEITGASMNSVFGNYIGTNGTGAGAAANLLDGIAIAGGSMRNRVGSPIAGEGNVISGNGRNGVSLSGAGTTANQFNANIIGLNAAGTGALGNSANGVQISARADGNRIGSDVNGPGNTISANSKSGILITGAHDNQVQQNKIGTATDGTTAMGNGAHGVFVTGGAANNLIGFLVTDILTNQANTIANNGGVGVLIGSDPAAGFNTPAGTGNAILGNSIYANGLLGIDLGAKNGRTLNDGADSDAGPNRLQNFPVITAATINGLSIEIVVSFASTPNSVYRIEIYASPTADTSNYGEGKTLLGWMIVVTNGAGQATGSATFDYAGTEGTKITATATNLLTNDTSEFSLAATAV